MEITESLLKRFWEKVDKRGPDECWEWTGARHGLGYGVLRLERKRENIRANRLSWIIHNGEIPKGLYVCHLCDNPPCCNPAHLWTGTYADNIRDMVGKGRNGAARGERSAMSRLTDAQVVEMRAMHATGRHAQAQLADRFGVGKSTVQAIVSKRTWKHVRENLK